MPSVLVIGAARGIGKAIVEHLASTGWDVIAGVRSEQDATAITKVDPQRVSAVTSTSPTQSTSRDCRSRCRSAWTRW